VFLFTIATAKLYDVECDWCDAPAAVLIYTMLPVQHACFECAGEWLRSQALALDGVEA
jgi:hypothetical protein